MCSAALLKALVAVHTPLRADGATGLGGVFRKTQSPDQNSNPSVIFVVFLFFFLFRLSQTTRRGGKWRVCLLSASTAAAPGREPSKSTRYRPQQGLDVCILLSSVFGEGSGCCPCLLTVGRSCQIPGLCCQLERCPE